ncbi:MAG: hypothetical protein IPP22_11690 [Nitrosomonas sp.]|nr:hypothetical protein [Nitrosomonas sp.]
MRDHRANSCNIRVNNPPYHDSIAKFEILSRFVFFRKQSDGEAPIMDLKDSRFKWGVNQLAKPLAAYLHGLDI